MWQPSKVVYGPFLSRRLGRSLGINLLGDGPKVCSFDCVYCECGPTIANTLRSGCIELPTVAEVVITVGKALHKPHSIEHITFSGNGEPTLHPQFLEIVKEVFRLRNQLQPTARVAVLTNASTLDEYQVVDALNLVDKPILKLDAGDEATFSAINRPGVDIQFENLVENMLRINHRVVQTMIIKGKPSNNSVEQVKEIGRLLNKLSPEEVQVYSLDREAWYPGIREVNDLKDIKNQIQKYTDSPVTAYRSLC